MIIVNIQLFGGGGAKSGAKTRRAGGSQKAVGGVNVADSGNSNSDLRNFRKNASRTRFYYTAGK